MSIELKIKSKQAKENLPQILLILIAGLSAILLHWLAVPIIFAAYILLSLMFKKQFSKFN